MRKTKDSAEKKEKTGPKPETVKIEGEWEDAIDKALKKKRPAEGWPKDGKKKPE